MDYQDEISKLSSRLKELFTQHKKIYATAESLTAGLIASSIVNTPGSSSYFDRGFITYSNEAKIELLDVNESSLIKDGAVSEIVARQMAIGALKNSHADYSVAVTGIAGPTGGSAEKPVGTVWFSLASIDGNIYSKRMIFNGSRDDIRDQTVIFALRALINITEGLDPFSV